VTRQKGVLKGKKSTDKTRRDYPTTKGKRASISQKSVGAKSELMTLASTDKKEAKCRHEEEMQEYRKKKKGQRK